MSTEEIIIVTYNMIPYAASWGSCQRMYYLADTLLNNGKKVTIISLKTNGNETFGNPINFNSMSLPVGNGFFKSFIESRTIARSAGAQANKKNSSIIGTARTKIKNNKLLFSALVKIDQFIYNEPTYLAGAISNNWCKTNVKTICDYIKDNKVKTLIISCPPFGMFVLAPMIKKQCSDIKIIFDYRDPWNLWQKRGFYASYLEKKYLKYADKVIFTNENLATNMSKVYHIRKSKIAVIENGYSSKNWECVELSNNKNNRFVITYTGSIDLVKTSKYGYRDATTFLEALQMLVEEGLNIKIVFVGVADPNTEYANKIKETFKGHIELVGIKNSVVANQYLANSNVLLLLHTTNDNSSKYLVCGKLYDYIRAKKYIFGICDKNGLNAKIIRENGLGEVCDNHKQQISDAIRNLYLRWNRNDLNINQVDVSKFSREYQNNKYYEIIVDENDE